MFFNSFIKENDNNVEIFVVKFNCWIYCIRFSVRPYVVYDNPDPT